MKQIIQLDKYEEETLRSGGSILLTVGDQSLILQFESKPNHAGRPKKTRYVCEQCGAKHGKSGLKKPFTKLGLFYHLRKEHNDKKTKLEDL